MTDQAPGHGLDPRPCVTTGETRRDELGRSRWIQVGGGCQLGQADEADLDARRRGDAAVQRGHARNLAIQHVTDRTVTIEVIFGT